MVEYIYKYQKFGAEIKISIKCEGDVQESSLDISEKIMNFYGFEYPYDHLVTFSQEK